ncbi:MAG: methionyl-tRNA formyltransferase [Paludibacteraceae bacterium]|nr:methionyl-tRNA formyltransferase [Paludibacteraceae bacterium]
MLRIIYMGTPDFAVEPLKTLVEAGKDVVAVVTMPDKPAGRGHKLQFSPVKEYALKAGIPVLQPENLKSPDFLQELASYNADLQIVVAFRMLPEAVWSMPKYGTFNLHASLLPRYRGAAPINWAVINGDKETGITTFFLKHEIDTGNIILQEKVAIDEEDNAGDVHDKLMYLGADLVLKTLKMIEEDNVITRPQDDAQASPAPKIFKDTAKLDFDKYAADIRNLVRGMAPYPAAWFNIKLQDGNESMMKIFKVSTEEKNHNYSVGTILTDGKKMLKIACKDGFINLLEVQMAGKKRMAAEDLMRGTNLVGATII